MLGKALKWVPAAKHPERNTCEVPVSSKKGTQQAHLSSPEVSRKCCFHPIKVWKFEEVTAAGPVLWAWMQACLWQQHRQPAESSRQAIDACIRHLWASSSLDCCSKVSKTCWRPSINVSRLSPPSVHLQKQGAGLGTGHTAAQAHAAAACGFPAHQPTKMVRQAAKPCSGSQMAR